ncbi:MAG: hypothetical protein ABL984_21465, partial [Pyrinomonadaceae bacterium]
MKVIFVFLLAGLPLFFSLSSPAQALFIQNAAQRAGKKPDQFAKAICDHTNDVVAARVFREYGAVFVVNERATAPTKCVFDSGTAVERFQSGLILSTAKIGSTEITLQAEAMRALLDTIEEASAARLRITPLDGKI